MLSVRPGVDNRITKILTPEREMKFLLSPWGPGPPPPQYNINLALGALSAKSSSQEVTLTPHIYFPCYMWSCTSSLSLHPDTRCLHKYRVYFTLTHHCTLEMFPQGHFCSFGTGNDLETSPIYFCAIPLLVHVWS
jgi:hypothetical protein